MLRFDFDTVDSTNDAAKRLIAEGRIARRAIVVAREQTAGKGTRGRSWLSPRDAGLYLSIVEVGGEPPRPPATEYTLAAGVACVEALAQAASIQVRLKPINDLYAEGRKLGGILTETTVQDGRLTSLIIGIGINLRRADRPLPVDAPDPVCLEELMPADAFARMNFARLTELIVEGVLRWSEDVAVGHLDKVRQAWERHKLPGAGAPPLGMGD